MTTDNLQRAARPRRQSSNTATRPNIRAILATTDFSDESRSGVRYAVALGKRLGATVELLHVLESPSGISGVESVLLALDASDWTRLGRRRMAAWAKRESKGGLVVTGSVRTGNPLREICTAAREDAVDLVVIATHGCTGAKRGLLGSIAERVVRHAPCPVLTVRTRIMPRLVGKAHPFKVNRILVPMDFSDVSKGALPWATFLAAQFEAEVVLLHVVENLPIEYPLGHELTSHLIIPLIKQAEADLKRAAADLARSFRINISAAVREGRPHKEIGAVARALGADLIVLTTHGYTGLKHAWLGSTAERVVRHAHCPVLVVRAMRPRA